MKLYSKIILFVLILIGVYFQLSYFDFILDDPFISFRYAANFANGQGLVFNYGEHVEGYTNFLWTILLAPFIKLKFNPVLISKLLGMVCSITTSIGTFYIYRILRKEDRTLLPFLSIALITSNLFFNLWTVGGLETPFYTLLLVLAIYQFVRETKDQKFPFSGILYAMLCMTRPDGIIFALTATIFKIYFVLKRKTISRSDIIWFLELIFLYGVYFLWRWNYYGMFLPNTFYAKIGGGYTKYNNGVEYLLSFLFSCGSLFGILFIAGLIGFIFTLKENVIRRILISNVVVQLLFIVYAGGDWMPAYRFVVPIIPLLAIIAIEGLSFLIKTALLYIDKIVRLNLGIITVILIACMSCFQILYGRENIHASIPWLSSWFDRGDLKPHGPYEDVAEFLNSNTLQGDKVALCEAGMIPFYCQKLYFIDYLGLIDIHISHLEGLLHQKSDAEYVLQLNPDWVILLVDVDSSDIIRYAMPPVMQFLNNKSFNEAYTLVKRIQRGTLGVWFDYFYLYKKVNSQQNQNQYDFYDNFEKAITNSRKQAVDNPWHSCVAKDLFTVKDEKRWGIIAIPDSRISYALHIPDTITSLSFGIGLFEKSWDWGGDGLRYEVLISGGKNDSIIYNRYLDPTHVPSDRKWCDTSLDLSDYANRNVTISFITKNDPGKNEIADWAIWSNPVLKYGNLPSSRNGKR